MNSRNKSGFTLNELLISIAIIAILTSIIAVSLDNSRKKSRDARRLVDMEQIQLALELYRELNGRYPGHTWSYGENSASCGTWDTSREDKDGDGIFLLDPLQEGGWAPSIPRDPLDPLNSPNGCGGYDYFRYDAGSYGCDPTRGDFYVLGVRDMESVAGPHPSSPGWSCSGRNWQNEFDWVTGRYTR